MKDKKIKKLLFVFLAFLLLVYGGYALFIKRDTLKLEDNERNQNTQSEDGQGETLTPEDIIKQLEGDTSLEGDIENASSFGVNCHWKFYINENNEEVLYKEMENRSGVSKEDPEICGFTSTFIDKVGKLRVVLDAEVVKNSDEVLESFIAEKEYIVK